MLRNNWKNIIGGSFFFMTMALIPVTVFAIQSGGGYIVNDQINPVSGAVSGGGYISTAGGNPISQNISGGGFFTHIGSFFGSLVSIINPVSPGGTTGHTGSVAFIPKMPQGGCAATSNLTFSQIVALVNLGEVPCRVDIFPDKKIDILDFNTLMVHWGKTKGSLADKTCTDKFFADINCDGSVNILDFNILMVYWSKIVTVK